VARDSTKITPKATQTNKAATALSNLLTVRSQGTTNSRNMNSILPTVNTAIKIKATTRSNPTKNNQEMEEDPTVRNPTIKTIMVGESEKTTWTHAHDIKSKVATKSSTRDRQTLVQLVVHTIVFVSDSVLSHIHLYHGVILTICRNNIRWDV